MHPNAAADLHRRMKRHLRAGCTPALFEMDALQLTEARARLAPWPAAGTRPGSAGPAALVGACNLLKRLAGSVRRGLVSGRV